MSWTVYILSCADSTLYTGITNNIQNRLLVHNSGRGAKYTRSRLPVKIVYQKEYADKSAAMRQELEIKRLTREEKLRLITGEQ